MINLFKPRISWRSKFYVLRVLMSNYIGDGEWVKLFGREFCSKFGFDYFRATITGTAALEIAYDLLDINAGDEVITPVLTCLYQNETVLLPNNKKVSIKKLVDSRYSGEVVSFNESTGLYENKKVIGWYKNPIGDRKWYRITFDNSIVSRSLSNGRKGVWLTDNHPVLTKRGYVPVRNVLIGDEIATSFYSLNNRQLELFNGTMLGDGYIRFGRRDYSCCRFGFTHTRKNEDYVNLKLEGFGTLPFTKQDIKAYKHSKEAVGVVFYSSPIWLVERKRWYENGVKILPKSFEKITPLSLAVWYMDDGSRQGNSAVICSESFSEQENEKLTVLLKQCLGIDASLQRNYRNGKLMPRIYIGNGNNVGGQVNENLNAMRFFKLVAPYIPQSLRYKLPESIESKYPFDENLWNLGRNEIFYDKAVVTVGEGPGDRECHTKFVYCIDVEDNHNFISKDVILHNCTATNVPLARRKANIIFADIDETLNIDPDSVRKKITTKTKAIVFVHFGGRNDNLTSIIEIGKKYGIPIVEDAAQAIGSEKWGLGDITCVSFNAIKTLTSGDGGGIICKDDETYRKIYKLRWYGFDRRKFQKNNSSELEIAGYKANMNNITAAIGLGNLRSFDKIVKHLKKLRKIYFDNGIESGVWFAEVISPNKNKIQEELLKAGYESGTHHYRNDTYALFGGKKQDLPFMNKIEQHYLLLPLHYAVSTTHVKEICDIVNKYR